MGCAAPAVPRVAEPEIDDDDWGGDDWELPDDAHWNDECPFTAGDSLTAPTLGEALTELHHQAHGPGPVLGCPAQPCRSLDLDQIRAL
jgi:hypothetical protein